MNISKRLFIYILFFINYQSQAHYTDPVSLIDEISTTDELHGTLLSQKPTIIELYSQNCPYCKMLSATFEDKAKKYRSINFLSADGKRLNAPKVINDFNNSIRIPGYPSILFIKNGKIKDYQIGGNPKILEEKIQNLLK